jgi:hypothetical protein
MKLRSGKIMDFFKPENQPFNPILLPEKVKGRGYGGKYHAIQERKNPNIKLYRCWAKWVHYVNTR